MSQTDGIIVTHDTGTIPGNRIALVTPDDPSFGRRLQELAGASPLETLGELERFCVIIQNISDEPIMAVSVRYDVTARPNHTFYWVFVREGLTARNGIYFVPGASYLVSPSSRAQALLRRASISLDELRAEVRQWLQEHQGLSRMAIAVDSILLTDGHLLGPDRSNSFSEFSSWLRAEDDLIRDLEAALAGKTGAEIERLLEAEREVPSTSFETRDHYGRRRQMLAQPLLYSLQQGGLAGIRSTLQLLKARPLVTLYK